MVTESHPSERAICVCGHSYGGHAHHTRAGLYEGRQPCHNDCECTDFVDSGNERPVDRSGHWPNMWELEDHNPNGGVKVDSATDSVAKASAYEAMEAEERATGVREVVFFQAVCQCCGLVLDEYGGDFAAVATPEEARREALEGGDWQLIEGLLLWDDCWTVESIHGEDVAVRAHEAHPDGES